MKTKSIISLFCLAIALILIHSCDDIAAPYDINTDTSIYGDGSLDAPYTIEGAQLNQSAQYAWVCAYIVGYIPTSDDGSYTISDVVYGTDGAAVSNFVIASSAESEDINDCMAVQLSSGTIRDSLNLSDNPDNLGKQVYLYGTMERYFGSEGVKNVTAAILDGIEIGDMPEDEEESDALFSETFSSSLGDFTIYNVTIDEGLGSEIWTHSSSYSCAYATAYSDYVDYVPAESWLVSPTIDLTEASAATLSFDHAGRFFNDIASDITLWIANASEGDPDTGTWTQLSIPNYPDGDSWTFVSSGDIDLNSYLEQAVKIAFRYYCTTDAGSYEVKNFLIEERNAEASDDEDGNSSEDDPFTVAEAIAAYDADEAQADTWVKGYIVGYVSGMSLNSSSAIFSADDCDVATNLLLADNPDETDYTNCLVIQLPSGSVREALNLEDNPDNLGKTVTLCGSLEKYFGTYGLKSVSEYVLEDGDSDEEESGDNSQSNPYTVADALSIYDSSTALDDTWVTGYIVGYVSGMNLSTTTAVFSADDAVTTNMMLADDVDETDYTNCLIIQLPSGDVREALNLSDNPDNLGRKVTLCGSLEKYFGTCGLKSVSEYSFEDDGNNDDDVDSYASFTQVTTMSSGVYLIVAEVGSTYYIAQNIQSSYSYDYLDVTSITHCGSTISGFDSDEHTFTFTLASNGYYTIKCEDGRYLYMTGSYTSFNVSSSPSSSQYFDVEPNSDGTFTITNTATNKWMQYNSSYSSYGIYDEDKGTMPYLFLKD